MRREHGGQPATQLAKLTTCGRIQETTYEVTLAVTAIGVKELKARAGELVRRIESGERILVTKRGRPVAAIVPVEDPDSFYDRVLEAVVGPSLIAAEGDLAAGRAVGLKEWTKHRPRSGRKGVGRQAR